MINDITLRGQVEGIEAQEFIHVWGTYQPDPAGTAVFVTEGWEPSTLTARYIQGVFEREGDTATGSLLSNGQRYTLAHVPAAVPNGIEIEVRGVLVDESQIVWSHLNTLVETTGWMLGNKNGSFSEVLLAPVVEPLPAPNPGTGLIYLGPEAVLERVELVYVASSFGGIPPPAGDCTCRIVQPAWRFTGHNGNGEEISVLVQALTDAYLKQP